MLAAEGKAFSAGHDFADVAARDLAGVRDLLRLCTTVMRTIQEVPQVVIARVQAIATAAGCQLVATCDLAVAAESAAFALPGGKAGWFCHTPAVPVARNVGRKRLMELALTGDPIDAATAADWGLINYAVPDAELDARVDDLLGRATRGSRFGKGVGKQTLYAQLDRPEADAYAIAIEVMASLSQSAGAREGMAASWRSAARSGPTDLPRGDAPVADRCARIGAWCCAWPGSGVGRSGRDRRRRRAAIGWTDETGRAGRRPARPGHPAARRAGRAGPSGLSGRRRRRAPRSGVFFFFFCPWTASPMARPSWSSGSTRSPPMPRPWRPRPRHHRGCRRRPRPRAAAVTPAGRLGAADDVRPPDHAAGRRGWSTQAAAGQRTAVGQLSRSTARWPSGPPRWPAGSSRSSPRPSCRPRSA